MKKEAEKKTAEMAVNRYENVTIDPALNQYQGKILFPKKLALAEKKLKGIKLPLERIMNK